MLGNEDGEGTALHGFKERVIGKCEQMGCAGYMGFVLPSSDLHSEFEVVSFSGGSWGWVWEVLVWMVGTVMLPVGTVWLSIIGIIFTVVICCYFLVFVRVGFSSKVLSFFIRGKEDLK